ncbi:hypothetical protein BJ742DRAFT_733642 [Cladochytrium replicatum]|nr:hypothetical protein BJ742DRAFT_733642 [Cladochytrium replicatum]
MTNAAAPRSAKSQTHALKSSEQAESGVSRSCFPQLYCINLDVIERFDALLQVNKSLKRDRFTAKTAQAMLNEYFRTPSPQRVPWVLLIDELDVIATKKQQVIYNFLKWHSLKHAKLVVVAIASCAEQISSCVDLIRMNFNKHQQRYQKWHQYWKARLFSNPMQLNSVLAKSGQYLATHEGRWTFVGNTNRKH